MILNFKIKYFNYRKIKYFKENNNIIYLTVVVCRLNNLIFYFFSNLCRINTFNLFQLLIFLYYIVKIIEHLSCIVIVY